MSQRHRYDVVVIGGGTAGSMAARTAADAGARTVMLHVGELGGLCILRGCMPTKTLLHGAHLRHEAAHHHTPGIGHADLTVDFAAVMAHKAAVVSRLQRAKVAAIEGGGYDVIEAKARFVGPDEVVAGGEVYHFRSGAVIATGSVPDRPPIEGLEQVEAWTSDDLMALPEPPASAIVVGAGAVGLELAQWLARIGTEVDLIARRTVLADADPLLGAELERVLADEPRLRFHSQTVPTRVRPGPQGGIELDVATGAGTRTMRAERLLLATGRTADLDSLHLAAAGVEVADGAVCCGDDMCTANPKVYVAGDATGQALLLHVASQEGRIAGLGAAGVPGPHLVDRRLRLEVVFTDPPVAMLGRTEAQARADGEHVVCASVQFGDTGRAITMDVTRGIWKLVCDTNGEILGTQILGPRADDLVHVVAAAMYGRMTIPDLLAMPWYHPTLSEVLQGLAREIQQALRAASPPRARGGAHS